MTTQPEVQDPAIRSSLDPSMRVRCSTGCPTNLPVCAGQLWPLLCNPSGPIAMPTEADPEPETEPLTEDQAAIFLSMRDERSRALSSIFAGWPHNSSGPGGGGTGVVPGTEDEF